MESEGGKPKVQVKYVRRTEMVDVKTIVAVDHLAFYIEGMDEEETDVDIARIPAEGSSSYRMEDGRFGLLNGKGAGTVMKVKEAYNCSMEPDKIRGFLSLYEKYMDGEGRVMTYGHEDIDTKFFEIIEKVKTDGDLLE